MNNWENLSLTDIKGEVWKDIEGYEGLYQASTKGRIKSLSVKLPNRYDKVERILKPVFIKSGNYRTCLRKQNTSKSVAIRDLIADTFIPNPDNKKSVVYKTKNRADHDIENLEWDNVYLCDLINKNELEKLYKIQKQLPSQIAKSLNVPVYMVRNLLIKYGIESNQTYVFRDPVKGDKYNRWTIIKEVKRRHSEKYVLCECECGTIKEISFHSLKTETSKSCGCYHRDKLRVLCWKGYEEISSSYWNSLKYRLKTRGITHNISIEYGWNLYIKQEKKCALSGLPIEFETKNLRKPDKWIASLDRINNDIGYEKGNVQWVVQEINYMKRTMTDEKLIYFCNKIAKYND